MYYTSFVRSKYFKNIKMKVLIINYCRIIANYFSYYFLKNILLINFGKFEKKSLYNKCYQYLYLYLYLKFYKKKKILEFGTGYSTLIINKYISSMKIQISKDNDFLHHIIEPDDKYFNKFVNKLSNKNNLILKLIKYKYIKNNTIKMLNFDHSQKYDFIYVDGPSPEWNHISKLKNKNNYFLSDIFRLEKNNNLDLFFDGRYQQQEIFNNNNNKKYCYIKSYLGSFGLFKIQSKM